MFRSRARARRNVQELSIPAPARGLIRQGNLIGAPIDGAEVLQNFFPTTEGARLRGGATLWATCGAAVRRLFSHRSGTAEKLFAATATALFDVTTPVDAEVADIPVLRGLTSGDWSHVQFANAAGQFVFIANGADHAHYFNGSVWNPVAGVATNTLGYDGLTADFAVGETVTGATSTATAAILAIRPATATTGVLVLGTITGTFQNDEALTTATGAAVANGTAASGSTIAITGVATADISFVWSHKRRLWFVEDGTLYAWHLATDLIGGAATAFPLSGVFRLGGSLLFGGTYSSDSGDGLDDLMVFITTEGEMAVYSGIDPGSDFQLIGVYRIGRPLDKMGWFRIGGDIVVMTEDGVTPVSAAIHGDRASMFAASLAAPIEELWRQSVVNRAASFPFSCTHWQSRTMLIIGIPPKIGVPTSLVANTRTGAWSTFAGWDVRCSAVHAEQLFFGTDAGAIAKADNGGTDMGAFYAGTYVPKFQDFGAPGDKVAVHARVIWRSAETNYPKLTCFSDYNVGAWPSAVSATNDGESAWGVGLWGDALWGGSLATIPRQEWQAVSGIGYALAPALIIGSNRTAKPTFELLGMTLRAEIAWSL